MTCRETCICQSDCSFSSHMTDQSDLIRAIYTSIIVSVCLPRASKGPKVTSLRSFPLLEGLAYCTVGSWEKAHCGLSAHPPVLPQSLKLIWNRISHCLVIKPENVSRLFYTHKVQKCKVLIGHIVNSCTVFMNCLVSFCSEQYYCYLKCRPAPLIEPNVRYVRCLWALFSQGYSNCMNYLCAYPWAAHGCAHR